MKNCFQVPSGKVFGTCMNVSGDHEGKEKPSQFIESFLQLLNVCDTRLPANQYRNHHTPARLKEPSMTVVRNAEYVDGAILTVINEFGPACADCISDCIDLYAAKTGRKWHRELTCMRLQALKRRRLVVNDTKQRRGWLGRWHITPKGQAALREAQETCRS